MDNCCDSHRSTGAFPLSIQRVKLGFCARAMLTRTMSLRKPNRFLWEGEVRSRKEMESLIEQSERGLKPGCAECERLERELMGARERDQRESNLDGKYEQRALAAFKEHRASHQ